MDNDRDITFDIVIGNKSPIRCLWDLIKGVFYLIISYLRIKIYNVLNYNNCSTDWSFPLNLSTTCISISTSMEIKHMKY
jgi:hypothetical protein